MFWKAAAILGVTYLGIAVTRLPRVNIDRPSAAFTGAVLMVLLGVLSFDAAVRAIDFNTIALLLGMMLLVVVLEKEGFFTYLAACLMAVGTTPLRLLTVVIVATGVLSAFLVNDAVVLLLTPVIVRACRLLRTNPVPYLIAEAMASNIGSAATIVGNPQNMLIGISSGISFPRFFLLLAPVAVAGCVALALVVWWSYRHEFRSGPFVPETSPLREYGERQTGVPRRAFLLLVPTVIAFFLSSVLGLSLPLIALTAGAAVLLVSRVRPSEVLRGVDWVLLLFFAGLFVVIGGARHAGVLDALLEPISVTPGLGGIVSLHLVSAAVSQVVSNVPLTMLVIPLIERVQGEVLWISLAAGATLGGNATIIGAVANIIVVETAAREGVAVSFREFLRVGMVVTPLTLVISMGILALEWALGVLS
ncbi:MAG: putative transporter [Dehalococcoidia bacterium]|nr:putative transporter [Dehalococcoidia bacterium]